VATGLKRTAPDCMVFTYQGDGDMAHWDRGDRSRGLRCERITVIFVNNAVFGPRAGSRPPPRFSPENDQLPGRARPPDGRYPLRMSKCWPWSRRNPTSPGFPSRREAHPTGGQGTRRHSKSRRTTKGFPWWNYLSMCPTQWKVDPVQALKWVEEKMVPIILWGIRIDKELNFSPQRTQRPQRKGRNGARD